MFNDDWMRKKGYLDKTGLTARDLVASREATPLFTLNRHDTVARAVQVMTDHDYSQIPITDGGRFIGSVSETRLYQAIVQNPEVKGRPVEAIMQPAFPFADISMDMDALARMITPESPAVLVRDFKSQETFIITRWDVIRALG
jgi:cystathionine beta-synthase